MDCQGKLLKACRDEGNVGLSPIVAILRLAPDGASYVNVDTQVRTLDLALGTQGYNDTLHCGGDDYVFGDMGNNSLFEGDGDDKLCSCHSKDTVQGSAGDDYDVIVNNIAQSGNDTLDSGADHAQLSGNRGNDVLKGGQDNDIFNGDYITWNDGAGSDYIDSGAGNDCLFGGARDDWLFGGTGDDARYEYSQGRATVKGIANIRDGLVRIFAGAAIDERIWEAA